ncbi:hypothetical protein [Spirillospora sp. NBC_01491]|uniref:hypothetical protein n=1 Tax=Spirillospora sp. NBC_01491 TaxID=2976007 RepID=UPI002E36C2B7|nr:hypothetical protein [Spirillospora sp. NBC_01491]
MRTRLVGSSPRGPRHAVPALLLAALPLTACGESAPSGGDFKPNGSLSSAVPTAAPPPSAIPTEQIDKTVLERYHEYQTVYQRAYEANDPAELGTVAVDPLLSRVTGDIERTKARGELWRFTNVSNAKVYARSKDGLIVYVVDCLRTVGGYRFSAKTGKRLSGGAGKAYLHRAAVRYGAGTWKVSETNRDKQC